MSPKAHAILGCTISVFFLAGCDSAKETQQPNKAQQAQKPSKWLAEQKNGPTLPEAVKGAPFGIHAKKAKGISMRSSITGVGTILAHNHKELDIKVAYDTSDRVSAYKISVGKGTLKSLYELWGAPEMAHGQPMWFNPKAGLRVRRRKEDKAIANLKKGLAKSVGIGAIVKEHELIFEPYIPLKTLLGPGKALAFLPKKIIGQSLEQVKAAYPDRFAQNAELAEVMAGELQFPATEYTVPISELVSSETNVSLFATDGKVSSFSFAIGYKDAKSKKEILDLLIEKYGKPKRGQVGDLAQPAQIFNMGGGLELAVAKPLMGEALGLVVRERN
jgi:hypothetical protein